MKKVLLLCMIFLCSLTFAQVTLTGKVIDENGEPLPITNVKLRGYSVGAVADFDGEFTITINEELPVTLYFSNVGYKTFGLDVTSTTQEILVTLEQGTELDVVIVSASRKPERVFSSPVSVEYYGSTQIKNTPAVDFYSGLENIKGVEVNSSSLLFKSVNTRGYSEFANTRFVQLVDGVDNSFPSLNSNIGNLAGISELDVNSIELLPGASSALYGANAFNGILTIKGKNPFNYEGISTYVKTGATSQNEDAAGTNLFTDVGIRVAKAFSPYIAAKANFTYFKGTDWFAVNKDNLNNPELDRIADPNYDGVNVYGDEINFPLPNIGLVSRTGYDERDLVDYNAENVKFNAALHIRPFADDLEIIYDAKIGTGASIFQNANRFYGPDYLFQQHKLEVRNDFFFVRGYISAGDSRSTYDTRIAAFALNNQWKDDEVWFTEYATEYGTQIFGGATVEAAHQEARRTADTGRLEPGTPEFAAALDQIIANPDFDTGGARFQDETQIRHVDANYNFGYLTNGFADIQVGGSFREYRLKSFGTVFTDSDPNDPISYSEIGAYAQIQKKLIDDRLKLTGSVRYDKAELFDGNFSPRLAVGVTLGEERNHNIRASFQSGFRNPTSQNLFMGLNVIRAITIGSAEENLDRERRDYELSAAGAAMAGTNSVTITGRDAVENSYTLNSVFDFFDNGFDTNLLEPASTELVKPEKVITLELGYRGIYDNISVEVSGYYNKYTDFLTSVNVFTPLYGEVATGTAVSAIFTQDLQVYNIATNIDADISSYGVLASIDGKIFRKFDLGLSYTYSKEQVGDDVPNGFLSNFNTPEHRVKFLFGSKNLFRNFGFNTSAKWASAFTWSDAFGLSPEIPSFTVVDAQMNYRIKSLKTLIKVGATNITGEEYYTGLGTGLIGSQYYIGLTINNL